eukprot:3054367-Amphidinium_carterae.1
MAHCPPPNGGKKVRHIQLVHVPKASPPEPPEKRQKIDDEERPPWHATSPQPKQKTKSDLHYILQVRSRAREVDKWGSIAVLDSDEEAQPQPAVPPVDVSGIPVVRTELEGTLTHVLLQGVKQPELKHDLSEDTVVRVLGQHRSGTRVLTKYIEENFAVDIGISKDHGSVSIDQFECWKHSVPPFAMPRSRKHPSVLMLCTIREPSSWMNALATHAYEIRPLQKRRRKQGDLGWMFEPVDMTVDETWKSLSLQHQFRSIPQLWLAYAAGYLQMNQSVGAADFLIVRHEDLVERPQDVVDALANLGLPKRASKGFSRIHSRIDNGEPMPHVIANPDLGRDIAKEFW